MGLLTKGNYLLTNWNSAGGVNGEASIAAHACMRACMAVSSHALYSCMHMLLLACVPVAPSSDRPCAVHARSEPDHRCLLVS